MPPDAKKPEELIPSDNSEQDEGLDSVEQIEEQASAAESSTATGEDASENGILSIVRDVVSDRKKTGDEEEAASPAEESEEAGDDTGDDDSKQETDDETFSDVPFHKHPRFQQLLRQRNEFKDDAVRYRNVQDFLDRQGLPAEEAAELLTIGGLMKTNPQEAWKRMKPAIQNLLIAAGEVLPDDLRERVQRGELTPESAAEISRYRAKDQSAERQRTFEQQRQEQERQANARTEVQNAVARWEQDRRAKDPNFDAKFDAILEKVVFLQRQEGVPDTQAGALEQLNWAYKAVALVQPAQRPRARPTNSSGQVAGNQTPSEPSVLDLVRANRRRV